MTMLSSVLFKKSTELEQEPQTLTNDEVLTDLLVNGDDPLYSDNVKRIVFSKHSSSEKFESLNSKSFRTIEKILQLKEALLSQQKELEQKLNNLTSLGNMLDSFQLSMSDNTTEDVRNTSCDIKKVSEKSIS